MKVKGGRGVGAGVGGEGDDGGFVVGADEAGGAQARDGAGGEIINRQPHERTHNPTETQVYCARAVWILFQFHMWI